jgi:hypothetical protein
MNPVNPFVINTKPIVQHLDTTLNLLLKIKPPKERNSQALEETLLVP